MTDLKNTSTNNSLSCGCSKETGVATIERAAGDQSTGDQITNDRGPGCCAERDENATAVGELGCCGQDCCAPEAESTAEPERSAIDIGAPVRHLDIEFLYLDLSVCERCQGTETSLEAALAEVSRVLELSGVSVEVRKTHVQTEEQASELGFVTSPTIRINGRDIQPGRGGPIDALDLGDLRESPCGCGSALCGAEVDCRDWVYQGDEFETPPVRLIVAAVLRAAFGTVEDAAAEPSIATVPKMEVPDNLKRFFAAKRSSNSGTPAEESEGELPCYPESPACRFP